MSVSGRLLLITPSVGFGGGIERVAQAIDEAWSGPVDRVDVYRRDRTRAARGQARVKAGFVARCGRLAFDRQPQMVLVLHLRLLPVAYAASLAARCPVALMAMGREVWEHSPAWERALVKRCSRLLAISSFTAKHFGRRAAVDQDDIAVIPLAVSEQFAVAARHEKRRGAGGVVTLLSVARIVSDCRYKGLFAVAESLPAVLRRRRDVRWLVVGDGDDLPALEDRCRELGVRDHVEFRGKITDRCLIAAYRESDIFVLPSVSDPEAQPPVGEGFGLVYAEAACLGLPSIASRAGGGGLDFVEHGVSGLTVPVDDAGALSETISDLIERPRFRQELADGARQRVLDRHMPAHFERYLAAALATSQ